MSKLATEDTIEKVARAIAHAHMIDDGYSEATTQGFLERDGWKNFRPEARAAINAMSDVREALELAREKMIGAVEPDDVLVLSKVDAALESLSGGGGE